MRTHQDRPEEGRSQSSNEVLDRVSVECYEGDRSCPFMMYLVNMLINSRVMKKPVVEKST